MKHFFITGLPRSRTGWLSVLFTYGPSICVHDVTRKHRTEGAIRSYSETHFRDFEYVGFSDSGLPWIDVNPQRDFPGAPVVIVERDPTEVVESLERVGVPLDLAQSVVADGIKRIQEFEKSNYHLYVHYDDLGLEETARMVWKWVLPDIPFNEERWKMLDGMTVDIDVKRWGAQIKDDNETE